MFLNHMFFVSCAVRVLTFIALIISVKNFSKLLSRIYLLTFTAEVGFALLFAWDSKHGNKDFLEFIMFGGSLYSIPLGIVGIFLTILTLVIDLKCFLQWFKNIEKKSLGIIFAGFLMVVIGLVGMVWGSPPSFIYIKEFPTTFYIREFSIVGFGLLYVFAGLFTVSMRKWTACFALACLLTLIAVQVTFWFIGIFFSSVEMLLIISGSSIIAAIFSIYIGSKWKLFT